METNTSRKSLQQLSDEQQPVSIKRLARLTPRITMVLSPIIVSASPVGPSKPPRWMPLLISSIVLIPPSITYSLVRAIRIKNDEGRVFITSENNDGTGDI
jgi:hypothetical protein